jgi:glutaminyl-tRNA synthetase
MRRRGVTPEAIINFVTGMGETKNDSWVEMAQFEAIIRDDLNKNALRRMAVLNPLKLVIDNYPEGQSEEWTRSTTPKTLRRDAQSAVLEGALYRAG